MHDRLLRHQNRALVHALIDDRMQIFARQQQLLGIRHDHAQGDGARGLIDAHARELQRAFVRVGRAVFERDLDLGVAVRVGFIFAARELLAQREHVRARLGHVEIHRVVGVDGRERRGLIGRHERAGRVGGSADRARDRRGHARIAQIDARAFERGLVGVNGRLVLLERRLGFFERFLADRVDGRERAVALGNRFRGKQRRLGFFEFGLVGVVSRLIRRGIDLIKHLPFAHHAAFGEQPLLDHARDLRRDRRGQERGCAPRHRGRLRVRHGLDRFHGHRLHLFLHAFLVVRTRRQRTGEKQGARQNARAPMREKPDLHSVGLNAESAVHARSRDYANQIRKKLGTPGGAGTRARTMRRAPGWDRARVEKRGRTSIDPAASGRAHDFDEIAALAQTHRQHARQGMREAVELMHVEAARQPHLRHHGIVDHHIGRAVTREFLQRAQQGRVVERHAALTPDRDRRGRNRLDLAGQTVRAGRHGLSRGEFDAVRRGVRLRRGSDAHAPFLHLHAHRAVFEAGFRASHRKARADHRHRDRLREHVERASRIGLHREHRLPAHQPHFAAMPEQPRLDVRVGIEFDLAAVGQRHGLQFAAPGGEDRAEGRRALPVLPADHARAHRCESGPREREARHERATARRRRCAARTARRDFSAIAREILLGDVVERLPDLGDLPVSATMRRVAREPGLPVGFVARAQPALTPHEPVRGLRVEFGIGVETGVGRLGELGSFHRHIVSAYLYEDARRSQNLTSKNLASFFIRRRRSLDCPRPRRPSCAACRRARRE
ncbi:hypothetical protein PT2222_220009 [Paraburkholderia tropica]